MANLDFIPTNTVKSTYTADERLEMVCKAFLTKRSSVYDGTNHYAPKVGVCKMPDGNFTFESEYNASYGTAKDKGLEFLFYPTTEEIRTALAEFKKRGYFPYYDTDVRYYGYVADKNEIRGEWTIMKTQWL